MPAYLEAVRNHATARQGDVPAHPRAPAEWEELQGLAITWVDGFWEIQAEIVRNARKEVEVYIVTGNEAQVKARLDSRNVDYSSNVSFVNGSYNSIWIRDFGPNSVYINDVDSLIFVDWIYNRPRYLDDKVPQVIGGFMGVQVVELATAPDDLVHTGGNFMSNGHGQGFSSNLVLDENGSNNEWGSSNHDADDVNDIMERYMGITEYVKMTNLPFDAIHHIDMHMKLVDEETLIMGEYPEGVADGPQIEANLQYVLDQFRTNYDRPFRVVRMPMPPDGNGRYPDNFGDYRTYANAIMINKIVLVPTYEQQYDDVALGIWRETLPGHDIVGINCNDIIPLSGALHCITKEIGVADPIWVSHMPIRHPQHDVGDSWLINATVKHRDSIAAVTAYYSIDGAPYDSLSLERVGTDEWFVDGIDVLSVGDSVTYYLAATSINGKVVEKPLTGSLGGGWRFVNEMVAVGDVSQSAIQVGDVFPNPASAMTAVPLNLNESRHVRARLIDQLGRQVFSIYNDEYPSSKTHLFFDASDIPTGSYIVHIDLEGEVITKKVIVQ